MPFALRNMDGKCHNVWFGMQMRVDKDSACEPVIALPYGC